MSDQQTQAFSRQQILDAFGVTEEDLAALEAATRLRAEGYGHMIGESRAEPTHMDDSPGYRRDW